MIKVEQFTKQDGSVDLVFESREKNPEALEVLDQLFSSLMGIRSPDITGGGYTNSFSFKVSIQSPSD